MRVRKRRGWRRRRSVETLTQRLEARSPPVVKVSEESRRGLHENVKGVEGWKYQTADTAVRSSLPVSRAEKVN